MQAAGAARRGLFKLRSVVKDVCGVAYVDETIKSWGNVVCVWCWLCVYYVLVVCGLCACYVLAMCMISVCQLWDVLGISVVSVGYLLPPSPKQ